MKNKIQLNQKLLYLLSGFYLIVSILLFTWYLNERGELLFLKRGQVYTYAKPMVETTLSAEKETISGQPLQIKIANVDIDLNVIVGEYKDGVWTLDDKQPSYATISAPPNNQSGITIIYGHATPAVFARTSKLQVNDQAKVVTDNGYEFVYQFESSTQVLPTDANIFVESSDTPKLVLITCDGLWDSTRRIMRFNLVEVNKL